MYLIIDKKTQAILHMSNSFPGEDKKPEEIFTDFDPATMEFGRAPEQFIPVNFTIENGVVKDLAAPHETPIETLDQAKERKLRKFCDMSLAHRRELIPDYQLLNAGIGIYEQDRSQSIRETVLAFREEYFRLEKEVAQTKSTEELEGIRPAFPRAAVTPNAVTSSAKKTETRARKTNKR